MIPLLFVSAAGCRTVLGARHRRTCVKKVRQRVATRMTFSPPPKDNDGKDERDDVDWNESWTRFRASGMVSDAPAGRQPPTEAEKAARRAREVIEGTKGKLPSREAVLADWRFWVGILLVLSLFTAYVNASHTYIQPAATSGLI